ncbi:hypothetical protein ACU4GD_02235 [Cupriavidus basilensis]
MGLQPGIEQRESRRQHACLRLYAGDKYPLGRQRTQICDRIAGRKIAMFHKHAIRRNQGRIAGARRPAKLAHEWRARFVMVLATVATEGIWPTSGSRPSISHCGGEKVGWTSTINRACRKVLLSGGRIGMLGRRIIRDDRDSPVQRHS